MSHPLEQRIGTLRARVRRLVVIYGLSAAVAAVLGTLIVLGLGDYLIRFQDRGIRVICWLALLGVSGWTTYRHLVLPRLARLDDVDLARRLQARFPAMEDRLVSAVEFLHQPENDPTAGSAALRRTVIAEITAETDRLDWSDVLDRRLPLKAVLASVTVALVAAMLVVLDPAASQIAMTRLMVPFGDVTWPQTTHLALRHAVDRVARGQPFEVEVIDADGARLPSEVSIHYRYQAADAAATEEMERMQLLGGAMVARRENVTRSFEFRIDGGDDHSMPWTPVEVLEPPAIQSLGIELLPPDYTGWPPERIGSLASIRALVGTRVRISGEATKPLGSAAVCLEGGRKIPARIAGDGLHFSTGDNPSTDGFAVEKSGAYWFALVDRDGLAGGGDSRWEINATTDLPPSVTIEQPSANLFVTPRAVVPLRVVAKDDLALHDVALALTRSDQPQQKESRRVLFTGPARVAPRPAEPTSVAADAGDRRVIEYRWELEALKLAPGTQVAMHVAATDYRPQTGKSEQRRLSVVTAEELQERIAARQNMVLAELARVLKLQRDSRSQVQSLEIRVRETGALGQLDVDRMQAAELNQRQASRSLTSRSDGVPMHILALLADLENNRLDNPELQRRMQALVAEIERLEHEHLGAIGHELTAAIKTAQIRLQDQAKSPPADAATAEALIRAGRHQDQVIVSLEAMLGQLRQWDDYRRFHRDVAQLLRDQEELTRNAADVGRRTLTMELKDLSPQESADLKVLTGRQLELARRLDRIEQEMEQALGQLRQSDPMAAQTVSDALDESRRLAIGAAMRSAGSQLQENRIGQLAQAYKQVLQDLQEVLDVLANRRQQELARLVKKLRETEADLGALRQQQEGLRKQIQSSAKGTDATARKAEFETLARRQELLRQQADHMARRLERLLAQQAGRTTHQAAGQMDRAGQAAGRGDAAGAEQHAEAAEKSLEEAARQLSARRLQAQAELAMEQLARLEDALKHLHRQEQNALNETRRLESLRQKESLTRAQAASLRELVRFQQSLQADTARLAESMAAASGFHLALSTAGHEMGRAAAMLDRRLTGRATQEAQQSALARLALLLRAVEPEKPGEGPEGSGNGGAGKQGGQPGGAQALAEFKLLKLMQEDINLRTRQLQQAVAGANQPTEEQQRRYALLSEEQGRLAGLVLELLKPEQHDDGPDSQPKRSKSGSENSQSSTGKEELP